MSFLYVNIIRAQGKFTTSDYRKVTFSGIYTHFDSFLPFTYPTKLSWFAHCYIVVSGFAQTGLSFN